MNPLYLLLAVFILIFIAPAAAAEPEVFYRSGDLRVHGDAASLLETGLGVFDWEEKASGAAKAELRFGSKFHFIGPAVGVLANSDGGYFGYAGLYADIAWRRLLITPFWGVGGIEEDKGKDMGGTLQFRSALSLAWQFDRGSRLGLQIAHISNLGFDDKNPGENDLLLIYAVPL